MTAGTDQLAACTTREEVRAVKDILDVEVATAQAGYDENMAKCKEHTLKANEFRNMANKCISGVYDVPKLIKDKDYEIEYG